MMPRLSLAGGLGPWDLTPTETSRVNAVAALRKAQPVFPRFRSAGPTPSANHSLQSYDNDRLRVFERERALGRETATAFRQLGLTIKGSCATSPDSWPKENRRRIISLLSYCTTSPEFFNNVVFRGIRPRDDLSVSSSEPTESPTPTMASMAAFAFNDSTQLIDIFGPPRDYNNLAEPRPFTNTPECLIGFTATFLVRIRRNLDATVHHRETNAHPTLGTIMDLRRPQALRAGEDGADARPR